VHRLARDIPRSKIEAKKHNRHQHEYGEVKDCHLVQEHDQQPGVMASGANRPPRQPDQSGERDRCQHAQREHREAKTDHRLIRRVHRYQDGEGKQHRDRKEGECSNQVPRPSLRASAEIAARLI